MGVVDLFSILPFYINLFVVPPVFTTRTDESRVMALMHVTRAIRILKLMRYSNQTTLFARTLQASYPALRFYVVMSFLSLILVAAFIFYFEKVCARVAWNRTCMWGHGMLLSKARFRL